MVPARLRAAPPESSAVFSAGRAAQAVPTAALSAVFSAAAAVLEITLPARLVGYVLVHHPGGARRAVRALERLAASATDLCLSPNSHKKTGGYIVNPSLQDRLGGVGETLLGSAAATVSYWGKAFDLIVVGAHNIAILGGAIMAMHGVWKIFRPRPRRRGTDPTLTMAE